MRALALAALALALLFGHPGVAGQCRPLWGFALDGLPVTADGLAGVQKQTGLKPEMAVFFLQWPRPGDKGFFPRASLEAISRSGAIPVLTWEPMYLDQNGREHAIPAEEILSGAWDWYLDHFADSAAGFGGRFIIRLAHEMNLARYHWGTAKEAYGPQSPGIYKKLFRHVVGRFRRRGAPNVLWAFCPNAESLPHPTWHKADWNRAANYYPGQDVVDVLGMDGYNWGKSRTKAEHGWDSRWLWFRQIFEPLRKELTALAPDKPLVVFETSTAAKGGDRSLWASRAFATARAWRLAGLCWFQADKEVDWRLLKGGDQKALDRLAAELAASAGCALPTAK